MDRSRSGSHPAASTIHSHPGSTVIPRQCYVRFSYPSPMVVIVMGVTGVGKTTVGQRLAETLGWRFHDADDFHPPANKAKMNAGVPLTDEDRWPWLRALHAVIAQALADGEGAVVTCSALKRAYRDVLSGGLTGIEYVHLTGDPRVV